jgi:hypothetical protein
MLRHGVSNASKLFQKVFLVHLPRNRVIAFNEAADKLASSSLRVMHLEKMPDFDMAKISAWAFKTAKILDLHQERVPRGITMLAFSS